MCGFQLKIFNIESSDGLGLCIEQTPNPYSDVMVLKFIRQSHVCPSVVLIDKWRK